MITVTHLVGFSLLLSQQQHLFAEGHARLLEPPSRASAFRVGFNTPADYNDNGRNCGGRMHQHIKNKGKCGICGDPWDQQIRAHEYGGKYATGAVLKSFNKGEVVRIIIDITANHKGHMEFRICPIIYPSVEATQQCLDRYLLKSWHTLNTQFKVDETLGKHYYYARLPENLKCEHCVLQWKYIAGNNWGMCENGIGGMGCGDQEEFRSCADIRIGEDSSNGFNNFITAPLPVKPVVIKHDIKRGLQTTCSNPPRAVRNRLTRRWRCKAISKMRMFRSLDEWCNRNCSRTPSYCPPSHCSCYNKVPVARRQRT